MKIHGEELHLKAISEPKEKEPAKCVRLRKPVLKLKKNTHTCFSKFQTSHASQSILQTTTQNEREIAFGTMTFHHSNQCDEREMKQDKENHYSMERNMKKKGIIIG